MMAEQIRKYGPPPRPTVGVAGGKMIVGETDTPPRPSCMQEFQRLYLLDNDERMRNLLSLANRNNVTFYPVNPSGIEVFDKAPHEQFVGPDGAR